MLYNIDRVASSDSHRPNHGKRNKHAPHSDLFVSSLKELYQRINKVLKLSEPFSLVYKELEDILLLIETKEHYFAKQYEGGEYTHEKSPRLKDFLRNQQPIKKTSLEDSLDNSITEDDSVQDFRRKGRELINEYKSVLDEMKNRNQALKSLYQPLNSAVTPHPLTANQWKPTFVSPTNNSVSPTTFAFSPIGLVSSPANQVHTSKFNRQTSVGKEPQNPQQLAHSYSDVLLNIEKFMRSLDQRTAGQSKRIESITQEIDTLKQQMQPYKHISEIRDIAEKLDEQRELLKEKFSRENSEKSLRPVSKNDPSAKQEVHLTKLPEKTINPVAIAEQIQNKAAQLDEIHNNFDECSKLLVRKRLEHTYARENGQLIRKSPDPKQPTITPVDQALEKKPQERFSQFPSSPYDFDVKAALSRRELRMKNYQEREERLQRGPATQEDERTKETALSCIPEDLSMTHTLKRSENQNHFIQSEAVEIRVHYGSKLNSVAKLDEELASTKKSCLSRRGFSSKENSASKGERRIRFADEEIGKRALKFEELEVSNPLGGQDLNTQHTSKPPSQKLALKGEISQLDKEIKLISQLLNSALLSEKISAETNI